MMKYVATLKKRELTFQRISNWQCYSPVNYDHWKMAEWNFITWSPRCTRRSSSVFLGSVGRWLNGIKITWNPRCSRSSSAVFLVDKWILSPSVVTHCLLLLLAVTSKIAWYPKIGSFLAQFFTLYGLQTCVNDYYMISLGYLVAY